MENDFIALDIEDDFQFSCGPQVRCFNECCRDLNQFLTPYDVIRLKNRVGLSCEDFLLRYTSQHVGPESGLPVVRLKQSLSNNGVCPFASEKGCTVYEDRPSSCRAYPIARAVTRNRETGVLKQHFMLLKEPHCKGFEKGRKQTVGEWMNNQGLAPYNEMNDLLMDIISAKNQIMVGPLDLKSSRLFHMACYDIDSFREKIFKKGDFGPVRFDENLLSESEASDAALLRVSLGWLKGVLFPDLK